MAGWLVRGDVTVSSLIEGVTDKRAWVTSVANIGSIERETIYQLYYRWFQKKIRRTGAGRRAPEPVPGQNDGEKRRLVAIDNSRSGDDGCGGGGREFNSSLGGSWASVTTV